MQPEPYSFSGFWHSADWVGVVVAILLLLMSVASWAVMLSKFFRLTNVRKSARRVIDGFWSAPNVAAAIYDLRHDSANPFAALALAGVNSAVHHQKHQGERLGESLSLSEFVTRALRQAMNNAQGRLETGLSLLASVGSTAPFVGLFGTVWGIYRALSSIGISGQATIDKVAGPVGEALIMTALGIAVAVPAVLGYNALTRSNRLILGELDSFAHDLHGFLATGARMDTEIPVPDPQRGGAPRVQAA